MIKTEYTYTVTTQESKVYQLTEEDIKTILLERFDSGNGYKGRVDFDEISYGGIRGAVVVLERTTVEGNDKV